MCIARALVTATAKVDHEPRWKVISDSRCGKDQMQQQMARELCEQAGVDPNKAAGIPDAKKFQIVILSKEHFNAIVYTGTEHKEKRLYFYHHDKHFDVITSITGFLSRTYYCTHCETGYQNRWNHTCKNVCKECFSATCTGWKVKEKKVLL